MKKVWVEPVFESGASTGRNDCRLPNTCIHAEDLSGISRFCSNPFSPIKIFKAVFQALIAIQQVCLGAIFHAIGNYKLFVRGVNLDLNGYTGPGQSTHNARFSAGLGCLSKGAPEIVKLEETSGNDYPNKRFT